MCAQLYANMQTFGETCAGVEATWGDYDGRTPLHFAARESNIAAVGVPCECAVPCILLRNALDSWHRTRVWQPGIASSGAAFALSEGKRTFFLFARPEFQQKSAVHARK
eukprot:1161862-Pelagomonas_calceolata.AAC.7